MFITHYYPENYPSLSRITQYSDSERVLISNKLSELNGSALSRFKAFEQYYKRRIQTEVWLYNKAKEIHLQPAEKSPWYFVLGENLHMHRGFGTNAKLLRLELSDINDADISFTIGDSIAIYFSDNVPHKLFDKEQILNIYNHEQHKIDEVYRHLKIQHQYIEAQLWTDKYF